MEVLKNTNAKDDAKVKTKTSVFEITPTFVSNNRLAKKLPATAPTTPKSIAPSKPILDLVEKTVDNIPTIDPKSIRLTTCLSVAWVG